MSLGIVGLLLFIVPILIYISIDYFSNSSPKKNTNYLEEKISNTIINLILTFILINIFSSLLLQSLGLFKIIYVYAVYLISVLLFLFIYYKRNKKREIKEIIEKKKEKNKTGNKKISNTFLIKIIVVLISLLILIFQFSSVHYLYNGKVSRMNEMVQEVNFSYKYPLFSDEWVAVEVVNKTIRENKLPTSKVFFEKPNSFNFFFGFHSFIAQIGLFFNLNFLTQYILLSIITAITTCILFFILLRTLKINFFISIITVLLIPYITSGSNLPGLWYLIPWNLGFLTLILGLIFLLKNNKIRGYISLFISLYFYPPIIVFIIPILICYFWFNFKENLLIKEKSISLLKYLVFSSAGIALLSFIFPQIFRDGLDLIIRKNTSPPDFNMLFIIHPVLWIVICLGMFSFLKNKKSKDIFIIITPVFGLILWTIYRSGIDTFIIDYHRVVTITSLLLFIFLGFGLNGIYNYLETKYTFNNLIKKILISIILLSFFITALNYTKYDSWKKLRTVIVTEEYTYDFGPAAPVNEYLIKEDLDLFSGFKNKKFLAPGWKGLVIGVATENIPLLTKSSTFTVKELGYNAFMNKECDGKLVLIKREKLDLVYSKKKITCPGFKEIGESSEGLTLYEL